MNRAAIRVRGVVQGVGFRPFVYALATELGVTGFVGNDPDGVFIEVQGERIDEFIARVRDDAPSLSVIEEVTVSPLSTVHELGFEIVSSTQGSGTTSIPPDTATCDACLAELFDPADRRYQYPFTACTYCGPRYTITTGLPYDREHTTMVDFPLCAACLDEYTDPRSRRFHAQPTACGECGPQYSTGVPEIVAALHAGKIVALKGIGGYHLVCDAKNDVAVTELRARKQRGDKPFAVMMRELPPNAPNVITSPARPIVIMPSFDDELTARVAPGNSSIGVMAPYAPIHHLLFANGAPEVLVMTSGNLANEPICIDERQAEERLTGIADVFVHHNRGIHVACDDSVIRASEPHPIPVRRSRGFAPLPMPLPMQSQPALAVGGELKTTICIADGSHAWMSQHIGDTENVETLAMLARTVQTLTELQRVTPELVISDLHPGYQSRQWAMQYAKAHGAEHVGVQHHHAHFASLLAEHRWPADESVLGVTFDGTGYGTDGTIWGGEFLLGSYANVERVGHLRPISLPGGDAATKHPARIAYAHLRAAGLDPALAACDEIEQRILARMLATGTSCTPTTSIGRLFDAIASLLNVRQEVEYEGQAAIELEALATARSAADPWQLTVQDGIIVLDPSSAIAAAALGHESAARAAYAFHEGLAEAILMTARAIREETGVTTVGLTGGVFANALLTGLTRAKLSAAEFMVLTHQVVPPNDGGLALGQVSVVAAGGNSRS